MKKWYLVDTRLNIVITKSDTIEKSMQSGTQVWMEGDDVRKPVYDPLTKSVKEGMTKADALSIRYKDIDTNTQKLIAKGFTFDGNKFSLSENAQLNWTALNVWRLDNTLPDEGVDIPTADDLTYHLAKSDVQTFVGTAFTTTKGCIDSGNAVKVSLRALATVAEIFAFVDPRS